MDLAKKKFLLIFYVSYDIQGSFGHKNNTEYSIQTLSWLYQYTSSNNAM